MVSQTNSTMIEVITAKQALLEEKIGKVGSFIGWEYARTNEWSSRHGTISFDRKLIDYTDGAYTVSIQPYIENWPFGPKFLVIIVLANIQFSRQAE